MEQMKIVDFYKGKEIFITGGTGFMGKVLIEKLLRSCPNLKIIYILMRPKKGKSVNERLNDLLVLPLFDNLRTSNPDILKKLIPISGDASEKRLGISEVDYKQMSNVSIIFHSAATIRFNGPLKETTFLNTRGTLEVVNFAKTLKKLAVLVHVSTAYCNPTQSVLEEKVYPAYDNWKDVIKIAENLENYVLSPIEEKFRENKTPNNYTYTKNIAESIINDHKDELPCVIFRPAIVVSSVEEPLPGWVENFNNVIGFIVGGSFGIFKTGNKNLLCRQLSLIPVDISIRGAIVAAYQKGVISKNKKGVVNVINSSICSCRTMTGQNILDIGIPMYEKNPFEDTIFSPPKVITSNCKFLLVVRSFIYHLLPALIIDNVFKYLGKKPTMMKTQRSLVEALTILDYFVSKNWIFKNENFKKYDELIPKEEYETFSYLSKYKNVTDQEYFYSMLEGIRKHLLKYGETCSPAGKKRYNLAKYFTYALDLIYYLFFAFILMILYKVLYKV